MNPTFQESGHSQFHTVKMSEDASNVARPVQMLRWLQCNSGIIIINVSA